MVPLDIYQQVSEIANDSRLVYPYPELKEKLQSACEKKDAKETFMHLVALKTFAESHLRKHPDEDRTILIKLGGYQLELCQEMAHVASEILLP